MSDLVDKDLAKSIARLKMANAYLNDLMKGRDWKKMMEARGVVQSSILWFKEASEVAPKTQHNVFASAVGVAMASEGEKLCKEFSESARMFFEVIKGGKENV